MISLSYGKVTDNLKLKTSSSCFQVSYHLARERLLLTLAQIPVGLLRHHQAYQHPVMDPDKNPLHLDWLQLGQTDTPARVLVLICGTHGVEGFAGSAVVNHCLSDLTIQLQQDPELGIVIIHGLNPWGFAWLRRSDHEGIDLNRNFIDFNSPLPENPEYELLHHDLFRDASKPLMTTLAFWRSEWGNPAFESTITRGQYRHADGLFYGGNRASWSRQILTVASETEFLTRAKRTAVIDFHTGLGPYGHGEVINDHEPNSPGFNWACKWYGANAQAALLGESCSPPKSGLLDYFWHELIGERGCFVTLEFGTYAIDKLLTLLVEEQRYFISCQNNSQPRDLSHPSVNALHDFFYPQDPTWRELILFRATQIISLALQGLRK